MSTKVLEEIASFARVLLDERLAQLTEPQRTKFALVYPRVTDANIVSAIDLCDRTIKKNIAGRPAQGESSSHE